jgi:hypothetical protein
MSMMIEIAETHPPQNGRKLGKVKTRSGQEFQIWPEKLAGLQVGQRYEVEVEQYEFNGRTNHKITKARPVKDAPSSPAPAVAATPDGREAERKFICDVLTAGVRSGSIAFDAPNLRGAVALLRALWRDVAA